MRALLKIFDAMLNKYTMYRGILYGLAGLLVIAEAMALADVISISPIGLSISIVTLIVSCYAANRLFAWLFKTPYNHESWLISALILACILPPALTVERVLLVALCGALAMASKYILVYRGSNIFNPAAVGAFVMSVSGLLPSTWWIATPYLLPVTILGGIIILRKHRRFELFFVFAAAALAVMLLNGYLNDQALGQVARNAFLSWPIVFLGTIMLTEPSTMPPTRQYRLLYGLIVGLVFASQLHIGPVAATPQAALIVGNIFTLLVAPPLGTMLRLKKITKLNANVYDVSFEKPQQLKFWPGQYLEWTLPHKPVDDRGNRRTFSIASSPTETDLHIGIKTYQPGSSFKKALLALKPGDYIRGAHVAGNFTLPPDPNVPVVFIAGGIGITPFRSMVRYMVDKAVPRTASLFYIASSSADFVYQDELDKAKAIGLQVHYIVGRLEAETLAANLETIKRAQVYISGPDAFVTHYKQVLTDAGVSGGAIKTDHFTGY